MFIYRFDNFCIILHISHHILKLSKFDVHLKRRAHVALLIRETSHLVKFNHPHLHVSEPEESNFDF